MVVKDINMDSTEKRQNEFVRQVAEQKYEYGSDVHTEIIDKKLKRIL